MPSSLDQLKASGTVVVSDSGDFASIGKYKPQGMSSSCLPVHSPATHPASADQAATDATTNPSLILAASKKAEYAKLIDSSIEYAKQHSAGKDIESQVDDALDRLLVEFGKEILNIIPGKVSTEVDARFSFDTKASVDKALHIIDVRILLLQCRLPWIDVNAS